MLRYYRRKVDKIFVMFVISLLVAIVSCTCIVSYYLQNFLNRNKISQLNTRVEKEIDDENTNKEDRYAGVRDTYPDLVGFVTYNYYNKSIKLPLMQTKDNDYYLYRDVLGGDSKSGTPFIDYRCDVKNSLLLVLYAHNMVDLSQFGALKVYRDKSYRDKYPYIYFESMYEKKCPYEVVAAFYSEIYDDSVQNVFKYYTYFGLESQAKYNYYVYNIRRMAEYNTNIRPKYGEKLIILSTCDYTKNKTNSRFAVLARKVENNIYGKIDTNR